MAMNDWPVMSLAEAEVQLLDCDHRTPPAADSGYPYVTIPQLNAGRIDFSAARKISSTHFEEWTRRTRPRQHDVVLSRRCNPGETAVVPEGIEFALGQNLVILRSSGRVIYPPFLFWLTRSRQWSEQVQRFLNVGAVFDSLKCAHIPQFRLPIPPYGLQVRIADLLGTLEQKVGLNHRTAAMIERLVSALFSSWFGNLDPDTARDGWAVASLGDHVDVTRGLSYTGAGLAYDGIPLHNLDSIYEGGGYKYEGIKHYRGEYKDRHVVRAGDLLVANTEQGFELLLIGFPALVPQRFGDLSLFSHHLYRVRPKNGSRLTARFLYLALMSPRLRQVIVGYSNGTTVNMLPVDALQRPRLAVPPAELVQRFDQTAQPLFAKHEQLQLESETLAKLRDLLLPQLMSGEIRLKEAEKAVPEAV